MRPSTACGGFLLLAGFITLVLKPVYQAGRLPPGPGVEATAPLDDIRPVPEWVATASLTAGILLLSYSWKTRRR